MGIQDVDLQPMLPGAGADLAPAVPLLLISECTGKQEIAPSSSENEGKIQKGRVLKLRSFTQPKIKFIVKTTLVGGFHVQKLAWLFFGIFFFLSYCCSNKNLHKMALCGS